jgi:hypothetical protein
MSQARVAEFHRRAAQERRLTGPGSPRARLVPVTIRYADSLDETALATLAALDSAEAALTCRRWSPRSTASCMPPYH